jgi:ATP-dependent RNA helicase RhlE
MTFKDLQLNPSISKAIQEEGYTTPTPIQQQAIPIVLTGADLLGCAQTGTGKTAAFGIPILQLLENNRPTPANPKQIRALIVTPTRELAIQIAESLQAYGRHTGLRNTVIFGGVKQHQQTETLKRGVDILIATPGRLLDLYQQGFISLKQLQIFVLDEADRMLDMGFINDVKKIIALLPKKRQSLFFSATMPQDIQELANTILTDPQKVEVAPPATTAETIQQQLYYVDKGAKNDLLLHLIKKQKMKTVLVFTRTKHGADKVVKMLQRNNVKAAAIHGNKSQNARQNALNDFKDGRLTVLVATDIAARGIDVDNLLFVINFEIPNIPETYVHRIGRTGRAGASGTAFSFCAPDEISYIKDIQKLIGLSIPVEEGHPYPYNPADYEAVPVTPAGKNSPDKHKKNKKRRYGRGPKTPQKSASSGK